MVPAPAHRHRRINYSAVTLVSATALLSVTLLILLSLSSGPQVPSITPAAISAYAQERAADLARPSRDGVRDSQWQLQTLNASEAWRHADGSGVVVAVIDSGVDATHPDLAGQVLPGVDLVKSGGDGRIDPVGHGTTVAALIAGRDDDGQGVVGLAPRAKILPVRVLDSENRYRDARVVAEGVRWAVDNGAHVINLSLGGGVASPALAEAIDYAFAKDVVVVACVGNESLGGTSKVWYPAREPGVLAVAALERRDKLVRWQDSITGAETVLAAPGADLNGARPGGYWQVQGTSFASPLVAASAALLRSRWPSLSAANVVNRLIRTARDLGPAGRDDQYGFGMVNPVAALTQQVPTVTENPLDNLPPPGRVGFGAAPGVLTEKSPASPPPARSLEPNAQPVGATFAAALVGVTVLVGGGLTLIRRVLP